MVSMNTGHSLGRRPAGLALELGGVVHGDERIGARQVVDVENAVDVADLVLAVVALVLAGLYFYALRGHPTDRPTSATEGSDVTLVEPSQEKIPTINILKPLGWPAGQGPKAAAGLTVTRFAEGLSHPRTMLTLPNGDVLCGATSSEQDACGDLRTEDHLYNLQRMNRLLGWCAAPAPASLGGRVGWRFQASDRLPIVGPVEAFTDAARSSGATRLRELPAEPGLFAATALGSRGITWAPLVGAVIAHWIAGEPPPLPTSLLQAIDPRRFALRRSRKSNGPA